MPAGLAAWGGGGGGTEQKWVSSRREAAARPLEGLLRPMLASAVSKGTGRPLTGSRSFLGRSRPQGG